MRVLRQQTINNVDLHNNGVENRIIIFHEYSSMDSWMLSENKTKLMEVDYPVYINMKTLSDLINVSLSRSLQLMNLH